MTNLEKYYKWFIKEMEDYKELTPLDFIKAYCFTDNEKEELKKEYSDYLLAQQVEEADTDDILDYDDWEEEVYYIENQDDAEDLFYALLFLCTFFSVLFLSDLIHKEPFLEIWYYSSSQNMS